MIYNEVRTMMKDKGSDKSIRAFATVLFGEFGRVNDGKEINDKKCLDIIEKTKKGLKEVKLVHLQRANLDAVSHCNLEISVCDLFLPKEASDSDIAIAINTVFDENTFKNKMQGIGRVKEMLGEMGFMADGKKVADMVKAYNVEG